jgi:hypothetical protein
MRRVKIAAEPLVKLDKKKGLTRIVQASACFFLWEELMIACGAAKKMIQRWSILGEKRLSEWITEETK